MNSLADPLAELEPSVIVQVDPDYAPDQFGGMLLVVKEVHTYGIEAYALDWGNQRTGPILVRVPFGKFTITGGRTQWAVQEWPR